MGHQRKQLRQPTRHFFFNGTIGVPEESPSNVTSRPPAKRSPQSLLLTTKRHPENHELPSACLASSQTFCLDYPCKQRQETRQR